MATTPTGLTVPVASDAFDPQGAVTRLANSVRGRFHVLAANTTGRTALAASCGWAPTAADPLVVLQTDTRVLWSYDGASWVSLVPTFTGTEVARAGTAPSAGLRIDTCNWSISGYTDPTGAVAFAYPHAFAGVTSVVVTSGDDGFAASFSVVAVGTASVTVRARNASGAAIGSQPVRADFVVSGWVA